MKTLFLIFILIFCAISCKKSSSPTQTPDATGSSTLDLGLVAYYPFNGNTIDSTGSNNNGVNHGAVFTSDRFDKSNAALSFNGSGIVDLGNILNNVFCTPVAKFSVSGWAMSLQNAGDGFLIGKNGGGNAGPYQWSISSINQTIYAQIFFDTLSHNYMTITTTTPTNHWFHFVLVFDGSLVSSERLKLYIDGQTFSVDSSTVGPPGTTTVSSEERLSIGANYGGNQNPSNFYKGKLDDIRIYNRPLSISEIQELYLKSN